MFTDIVDSTRQATVHGDAAWRQILDRHDQTTAMIVRSHRGRSIE